MVRRKKLSRSMEDYLEAIYLLAQERGYARVKEIAERMDVHMPSVTGALRTLSDRGLVNYEPYAVVTLTEAGVRRARRLVRTHETLRDFLERFLGVPEDEADEAACRMEHAVGDAALERLTKFIEFVDDAPEVRRRWLEGFAAGDRDDPSAKGTRREQAH